MDRNDDTAYELIEIAPTPPRRADAAGHVVDASDLVPAGTRSSSLQRPPSPRLGRSVTLFARNARGKQLTTDPNRRSTVRPHPPVEADHFRRREQQEGAGQAHRRARRALSTKQGGPQVPRAWTAASRTCVSLGPEFKDKLAHKSSQRATHAQSLGQQQLHFQRATDESQPSVSPSQGPCGSFAAPAGAQPGVAPAVIEDSSRAQGASKEEGEGQHESRQKSRQEASMGPVDNNNKDENGTVGPGGRVERGLTRVGVAGSNRVMVAAVREAHRRKSFHAHSVSSVVNRKSALILKGGMGDFIHSGSDRARVPPARQTQSNRQGDYRRSANTLWWPGASATPPARLPNSTPGVSRQSRTAQQIVDDALLVSSSLKQPGSSHCLSRRPAQDIYSFTRQKGESLEDQPILDESARTERIQQAKMIVDKTRPQTKLSLNGLAVDWADWTVPDALSHRGENIRPQTCRPAADTPDRTNRARTTSGNAGIFGAGCVTDRPVHARSEGREMNATLGPQAPASGTPQKDRTISTSIKRPLTSEAKSRFQSQPSGSRGKANNLRAKTSEGRQRFKIPRYQPLPTQATVEKNKREGGGSHDLLVDDGKDSILPLSQSSIRSAADVWSGILDETAANRFVRDVLNDSGSDTDPLLEPVSEASECSPQGMSTRIPVTLTGNQAARVGLDAKEDINRDSHDLRLNWIGSNGYQRYVKKVEDLVADASEDVLALEQDDRVRKFQPMTNENNDWRQRVESFVDSVFHPTGPARKFSDRHDNVPNQWSDLRRKCADTASVVGSEATSLNFSMKKSLEKMSVKEALHANERAKQRVLDSMVDFLEQAMERVRWGNPEAPTAEAGLADLIRSMEEYDDETVPAKMKWMRKEFIGFLKLQGKHKNEQLVLEGRAHAASTLEEAKCYVSAFYSSSMERYTDNNEFATKNWDGMGPEEILKHSAFLKDLEYVKRKGYDLLGRWKTTASEPKKIKSSRWDVVRSKTGVLTGKTEPKDKNRKAQRMANALKEKGFIRIKIIEACNLPKIAVSKKSADTFVRCELRTENEEYLQGLQNFVVNSDIVWDSYNPEWKKEFEFCIPTSAEDIKLVFTIFDVDFGHSDDATADKPIGTVEIPFFEQGFQSVIAEEEVNMAYHLKPSQTTDEGGDVVLSNQKQAMGRPSSLRIKHMLTQKVKMTFNRGCIMLQCAYRNRLARIRAGEQKQIMHGFRNRDALLHGHVNHLGADYFWNEYSRFCLEEGAHVVSELKRQFEHKEKLKLVNQYLSLRGVRALGRMFTSVYPEGVLRSLEISFAGLNSPGMVMLAQAIKAGCTALTSLKLDGNPFTQETNDVSRASNPTTNRLGRGLSGCRVIAETISETTTLKTLSLQSCKIGNLGLAAIATALQTNRSIEFLNISDTNMPRPEGMPRAATELGKMLEVNTDILELQCHSVVFPGDSALALLGGGSFYKATGLRSNSALKVLNLSRNNLCRSHSANAALRDFLCSDTCFVEHLDLGYNHMDSVGVLVFSDGLIGNNSLRSLILDGNELGVIGCRTLLSYRGRKTVIGGSTAGMSEVAKMRKPKSMLDVRKIFDEFDADGSGALDVIEMEEFLSTVTDSLAASVRRGLGDAKKIIETMDNDGSGVVEFEEFFAWYMATLGIEDDGEKKLEISLEGCNGFTNTKAFDPSDPNGSYRLDMSEPSSRSILSCMMQLVFSGKAEFLSETLLYAEEGVSDDNAAPFELVIGEDPTAWKLPEDGVLLFDFGMLRPMPAMDDVVSSFIMNHFIEGLAKPTREERDEIVETCTGDDAFFKCKQIEELLAKLTESATETPGMPFLERQARQERQISLEEERVELVSRLFLRMVDRRENQARLLDHLNPRERALVETKLGIAAYSFDPLNATGFHRLDLRNRGQREILMRLIEIRNSQRSDVTRWKQHLNRSNGNRDDCEIILRNLRHDGKPMVYSSSWRVPHRGIIEVDFVDIRKADVKTAVALDHLEFSQFVALLEKKHGSPTDIVMMIREAASTAFFTCLQLWRLLRLFNRLKAEERECRVDVCVACFSRVIDWRAMRRVYIMELLPQEMSAIEYRIGKVNIYFDEVSSAVGYWELDLSSSEDRWITQELVYLASVEPGYNVVQCKLDAVALADSLANPNYRFDGVEFSIPKAWVVEVPQNGVLKFFYARTKSINESYINTGSWNGKLMPLVKPSSKHFTPSFRVPAISPDYDEKRDGIESTWIYIEKIRVIKSALLKVHTSAKKMFKELDQSGDGDLQRKELALGLFRIGVWLTPAEAEMLLQVIDVDGSGEVDAEEFDAFWRNAPPFRFDDREQFDYWVPRRCSDKIFEELLAFYDIRMGYPRSNVFAISERRVVVSDEESCGQIGVEEERAVIIDDEESEGLGSAVDLGSALGSATASVFGAADEDGIASPLSPETLRNQTRELITSKIDSFAKKNVE